MLKLTQVTWAVCLFMAFANTSNASVPGKFTDFTVDAVPSGRLFHSVPVDLPPGIDGFSPQLSLSYENDGPNGLIGHGWRLSGLSSVTRCAKTIAQDGHQARVDYSLSDRLCLDGNRILTPTPGLSGSAADAAYHQFTADTTLEIDRFARIQRVNGLQGIRVDYKDGLTGYYGNYDGSHADACVVALTSAAGATCGEFKLSRLENRRTGDFASYVWEMPSSADRVAYLKSIAYGAVANYVSKVLFEYETRPDIRKYYIGDLSHSLNRRLKKISSFTAVASQSDLPANVLRLRYSAVSGNGAALDGSQLAGLQKCRTEVDAAGVEIVGAPSSCQDEVAYTYDGTGQSFFVK
ncbi:MAG: SpvB/TcaC N-terminal domain-containing protein, partial [Moraxellaceae bacterium]|nr:SpvB/TcaC N-terminal domain-containing protein [Moraxellaceae bacterium]